MSCNFQCLSNSGSNVRSSVAGSFIGLLIAGFTVFEGACHAEDWEFVKHVTPVTDFIGPMEGNLDGPSFSTDGRYSATELTDSNDVVIKRQSDGMEIFRFVNDGKHFLRLKPTFSQNSEFIATHSFATTSKNSLIVHQCSTGKKMFETNLSVEPSAITFSNDWIFVAGKSLRKGGKYSCQILRSDNGSEFATLIIATDSEFEFIKFRKIELDETHLYILSTSFFRNPFSGESSASHVIDKWNWKRVLELSQQGENIITVGSQLDLAYKRNNLNDNPLDELEQLGAWVRPFHVQVDPDSDRSSTGFGDTDPYTGGRRLYINDPEGGLSIYISDLPLSDRGILDLLKKIPSVKEIIFSPRQLGDLRQLSQISGLENLVTQRTLSTTDYMDIANFLSLKRLPHPVENDDALQYVGKMNSIEYLTLASKKVTDTGINWVSQMKSLKAVGLLDTGISSKGLKQLEEMPNLEVVLVDFGSGISDQALQLLVGSKKIRRLSVDTTLGLNLRKQVSDAGLEFVGGIANLEDLYLNSIKFTDVGVEHLLELKKLKRLRLMGTSITDRSLLGISRLPLLTTLDLRMSTKLTDAGLLQLQNIKTLRMLEVSYTENGISMEGIAELRKLRPDLHISAAPHFQVTNPNYAR